MNGVEGRVQGVRVRARGMRLSVGFKVRLANSGGKTANYG